MISQFVVFPTIARLGCCTLRMSGDFPYLTIDVSYVLLVSAGSTGWERTKYVVVYWAHIVVHSLR